MAGREAASPPADTAAKPAAEQFAAQYAASPRLRERMATVKRVQIEQRYSSLLSSWKLPPDDNERVIQLLLEADLANTDHGLRLMAARPDERIILMQEFEEAQRAFETRMQGALPPGQYVELGEFKETLPFRQQVEILAQRLARTGEPLTPDQSSALVAVLREFRRSPAASVEAAMAGTVPGTVDDATLAQFSKAMEEADAREATQASAVLSPAQADVFRQIQTERAAGTMRGLEMMKPTTAR